MKIEDNIETFNSLLKRRGFIWGPSPEIYGGLAGFYSYGPAGKIIFYLFSEENYERSDLARLNALR